MKCKRKQLLNWYYMMNINYIISCNKSPTKFDNKKNINQPIKKPLEKQNIYLPSKNTRMLLENINSIDELKACVLNFNECELKL